MTNKEINNQLKELSLDIDEFLVVLEDECNTINTKLEALELKASKRASGDFTPKEQERYYKLESRKYDIENLQEILQAITWYDNLEEE